MNQYFPQGFQPYTGGGQQTPYPSQQVPPSVGMNIPMPTSAPTPTTVSGQLPGQLPIEQSYIENILRLNKGKLIKLFATFENNKEWNAKEFDGVIEAAGRDHVILSDPQTGARYLIPMVAVDYIQFKEPIEYEYPFAAAPSLSTYPPR
ncbi:MAG: spore coat protein GerQ [Bacillota bacterium]|nr:spore coat protein GerQ [Bacillota bacterium]